MAFNFSGKKILVTGASRGIGRGIALALANSGCKVYALARNKDLLESLATESSNIVPVVQDLGNWGKTRATLEKIEALDGLVNNAGILQALRPALEQSKEELDNYMNINVLAAINCIQVIGNMMVEEGIKGSIVNISSGCAIAAAPNILGYNVSKAALDMVTKQFALELGPHGIRVNSANMTVVMTEILQAAPNPEALVKNIVERTPFGRIAKLEEVVYPVLYLLSEGASMVTGTTHVMDGGLTCNITTKQ